MPGKPARICIIGLGRAGNFHLQSLRMMDDAKIATVFDSNPSRAEATATQHGCFAARSVEEAIDKSKVDAVLVATPTDSHFEYIQRCIDADIPVLSEKPIGRHLGQIDTCFENAAAKATPLFVAFQRRFDPSFSSLVEAVHSGNVGQLQFVRSVSRDNPVPPAEYIRISGGIFHDCMVHDLEMVSNLVGEVPTYLSAFGSSFIDYIREADDYDNVVASLSFPSGVTATIDVNRKSVYGYDQRIEAFGDGGMLQADNHHRTSLTQATENSFQRPLIDYSFPTRYSKAYLAELQCFVRCVRGEQEVPISHKEVRVNHLLAVGLEIAAKEKRIVRFEEIESTITSAS